MGSPLRIGVLIGHGVEAPLPEAAETAKNAVNVFCHSGLDLEIWVDAASASGLRRIADERCELLLYYGHGTEAGQLLFVDGAKNYSELSAGLGLVPFWSSLHGTILFACHSGKFAAALPCPWLAFTEEILRQAPHGFMNAWIRALKASPLRDALHRAHEVCRESMGSNFPDCLEISGQPWPELRVSAGTVRLRRASPGLTGRLEVDFASVVQDGRSYPEHDPFVGRVADLTKLMELPDPDSDHPLQQFFWVSGDPGIGKSALLRQHACQVRDLAFADEEGPVWVLHAYCLNCIQPRDVEQTICKKAKHLYGWEAVPDSFHHLFKRLPEVPGIHVWILDDLTYLRPEIGKEQDSLHVPRLIADMARAAAIPLQLAASARFAGPPGWEPVKIEPLGDSEAVALARLIKNQAKLGITHKDTIDVHRLFARCGRSTVHFKRALILAVARAMSFEAMADELGTAGALEGLDETEFSKKLIHVEVQQLDGLSRRHGFAYRRFFNNYWPLIIRAGHFTADELRLWFPTEFHVSESSISVERAHANGLTQLVRLGFLAMRRETDGDVLYMPPNQRLVMQSLAAQAPSLPASVPFRAPKARLSSALERARKGQFAAIGEILALEQEYADHIAEPEAAEAVAIAMRVRAELVTNLLDDPEAALKIYGNLVTWFGGRDELPLAEQTAQALVNKGITLGELGRSEEEIVVYDDLVTRFGGRDELPLAEPTAKALVNKGVTLGQLGRSEEAIVVYDDLVTRFGGRDELPLAERTAQALVNKGIRLGQLGRSEEEIVVYDDLVTCFGGRDELPLAERTAQALVNKGITLGQLGRSEEATAAWAEVSTRFGHRSEPEIQAVLKPFKELFDGSHGS